MKRQAAIFYCLLGITVFLFSCSPEKKQENKIDYIKKDAVYLTDGTVINLGDSLMKVYYLIRHAEKDTMKNDPPLSKAGMERAARLTKIMRQSWLDAVYTTLTTRTMMTVDSITQYKGLSNHIYTTSNMKETFTEVKSSVDKNRVLVVGHSNTIPPLANFLLGKTHFNKTFGDEEYDHFIIITQGRDSTMQLREFKY